MGDLEAGGLPLWLFVTVVLLPVITIILPLVVIWRRILQRGGEQVSPPSEKLGNTPMSNFAAWKVRALQPFRTMSLPEPKFQFGGRRSKRRGPRKWPETTYREDSSGRGDEESSPRDNWWQRNTYGDHLNNLQRESWASVLRRLDFRGHGSSLSEATVKSNRASYVSSSTDSRTLYGDHTPPPKSPNHDMRWLDTPSAQLSPLTPLDLPWSPMSTIETIHLAAKQPKQLPVLPIHKTIQARDRQVDPSRRRTERVETKRLESWLARSHDVRSSTLVAPCHDNQRSSVLTDSFLQAWTKVYYQYLGVPVPNSPLPPIPPPKIPPESVSRSASTPTIIPRALAPSQTSSSTTLAATMTEPMNKYPAPAPPPIIIPPTVAVAAGSASEAAPAPTIQFSQFNFMLSPTPTSRSRFFDSASDCISQSDNINSNNNQTTSPSIPPKSVAPSRHWGGPWQHVLQSPTVRRGLRFGLGKGGDGIGDGNWNGNGNGNRSGGEGGRGKGKGRRVGGSSWLVVDDDERVW